MQLSEAQEVLSRALNGPRTAGDALAQVSGAMDRARAYLADGNTVQAQAFVEQGFTHLMAAFHFLDLDLERVVARERSRNAETDRQQPDRAILIFSDHAELRVGGELRGTIPLYADEDYRELRQIAQLFQCRLEHASHAQLSLFAALGDAP